MMLYKSLISVLLLFSSFQNGECAVKGFKGLENGGTRPVIRRLQQEAKSCADWLRLTGESIDGAITGGVCTAIESVAGGFISVEDAIYRGYMTEEEAIEHGFITKKLITDAELATKFAPFLRFDSSATSNGNGFPSTYVVKGGRGLKYQNTNPSVSGIPTYYKLYREAPEDESRVTTIGYYWSYEYQVSCMLDTVIPNPLDNLPDELTDVLGLGDLNQLIGDVLKGNAGAHSGDVEKVFVNLNFVNNAYSLRSVTFTQHGGKYTVPVASGKLQTNLASHPHVYVGRRSHGSYHNAVTDVGGCGYFHDYRDGAFVVNSWDNLKDIESSGFSETDWEATYGGFGNDNYCKDSGCSWTSCENRANMISNAEKCTPLTCHSWSTGCLVWGLSDIVEAAASFEDKLFRLYSTGDPDCGCTDLGFLGEVCIGEEIEGEVCYPATP